MNPPVVSGRNGRWNVAQDRSIAELDAEQAERFRLSESFAAPKLANIFSEDGHA